VASHPTDQPVTESVLDRLIDDDPESSVDPPRRPVDLLADVREAVRRDLQSFLNTRQRCLSWPTHLDELDGSLVGYGIPDFTGANMGARNARASFQRSLESLIKRFEPRFKTVRVELMENADQLDRTLRLRIDALLHAEPSPEPLSFDTYVEPVSRAFEVSGASDE